MLLVAVLFFIGVASAQQQCVVRQSGVIDPNSYAVQLPDLTLRPLVQSWRLEYTTPIGCEAGVLEVSLCDDVLPVIQFLSNADVFLTRRGSLFQQVVVHSKYYCPMYNVGLGRSPVFIPKKCRKNCSKHLDRSPKPVAVPLDDRLE